VPAEDNNLIFCVMGFAMADAFEEKVAKNFLATEAATYARSFTCQGGDKVVLQ